MKKELCTLAVNLKKLGLKKESKKIYDILKYAVPIEEVTFSGRGGEIENKLKNIIDQTKAEFQKIDVTFDIVTVPKELQITELTLLPSTSLKSLTKDNSSEEIFYTILNLPASNKEKVAISIVIDIMNYIYTTSLLQNKNFSAYYNLLDENLAQIDKAPQEGYKNLCKTLEDMKEKINNLINDENKNLMSLLLNNINKFFDTFNKIKKLSQWIKDRSSDHKSEVLIIWGLTGDSFSDPVSIDTPYWIIHDMYHIIEGSDVKSNDTIKQLNERLLSLENDLIDLDLSAYQNLILRSTPEAESFDYYASLFAVLVTNPEEVKNLILNSKDTDFKEELLKKYQGMFNFAKKTTNEFSTIFKVFKNRILFLP